MGQSGDEPETTSCSEEGEFILSSVPAGAVTLIFEGPGPGARVAVSGLLDGQVLSLQVHLSGGTATITAQEPCAFVDATELVIDCR